MTQSRMGVARAAQVWWAFVWRSWLILAVRILLGIAGIDIDSVAALWAFLGSVAVTVGASVWAMRQALEKDYGDFRIWISEPFAQSRLREMEDAFDSGTRRSDMRA